MDITELLHRASDVEPDVDALVTGGMHRGRHRVLAVRAVTGVSAAALAACVAVLVVALLPSGTARSQRASGPPSKTPPPATVAKTVPITPQAMLQRAIDSLPRAGRTGDYGGNFGRGHVAVTLDYYDGHGAAALIMGLDEPTSGPHAGAPAQCAPTEEGCRVLADGAHAMVRQGKQYQDGRTPNATEWSVELVRTDGVEVSIYEYNASQPKGAQLTRTDPPFTIDELVAWADGAQWVTSISPDEAKSAAHLFRPDDIDAPPPGTPTNAAQKRALKKAEREQRAHNCKLAKQIHKTPPSYCTTK